MSTLVFLVLFPLLVALLQLIVRDDRARTGITVVGAVAIAAGSIMLAVQYLGGDGTFFSAADLGGSAETIGYVAVVIDVILSIYIIAKGVRHAKWLAVILAAVQISIMLWFEFSIGNTIAIDNYLYVDRLSVIMALIIGIIGTGICVYALGYMRDHARIHPEQADRRPVFFSVMFAFLSAMFALVFSNDLLWLFTAWEATTVCSFALIGYTQTDEAVKNSFLQIVLNLVGGLAFAIAIVVIGMSVDPVAGTHVLELDRIIKWGAIPNAAQSVQIMLPIALLCLAGLTKAAQMPFHSWLLGAMVAPTPTSALLHSSTMVKAGVFLLIKLAPDLGFNAPGIMVMLIGGVTFLLASCMAISQSNAKRVLAYSTIANLGLIAACAGTGTAEGVWAAIFLLIFHACAKSLLFCCVGTAEHHIGSRNIEDMDLLFERMPRLARLMILGMMIMFIAPLGMLVSKWAALQAFIDSGNLILIMLLAFGSAATFFFWAKWIGKLSANAGNPDNVEGTVWKSEWVSLAVMSCLAACLCVAFPVISDTVVVPYLTAIPMYKFATSTLSAGNLWLMAIMSFFVIIMVIALPRKMNRPQVGVYLSGSTIEPDERVFKNSFSQPMEATQSNWYLDSMFGEKRLDRYAVWGGIIILAAGIIASLVFMITGGAF